MATTLRSVTIWWMNGPVSTPSSASYVQGQTGHDLIGAGDFSGDGIADLLWLSSDGALWITPIGSTGPGIAAAVGAIPAGWELRALGDFDGNAKTDLAWFRPSTGEAMTWQMNGSQMTSSSVLGSAGAGFELVGAADFNFDTRSDLLWQRQADRMMHIQSLGPQGVLPAPQSGDVGLAGEGWVLQSNGGLSVRAARTVRSTKLFDMNGNGTSDVLWHHVGTGGTGEYSAYLMENSAIQQQASVGTVSDLSWIIAGSGDFDGDGKSDILWRKTSGAGDVYIQFMNGASILSSGYISQISDQGWVIAGTGDFNGDGKSDIYWRHTVSGDNFVYLMNGLSIESQGYMNVVADTAWKIAAIADLDGDGKADVLWRHAVSGENYVEFLNGLVVTAGGYLPTVADTQWEVRGAGDFDGDGKSDILWYKTGTGEVFMYLMNGLNVREQGFVRTIADLNWRIVRTGDYDGDGRADIFWRNEATGENYLWPMRGMRVRPTERFIAVVPGPNWKVVQ